MKKLKVIIFCFFIVTLTTPAVSKQERTLRLCTATDATEVINAYYDFLKIAYKELGYHLTLEKFPVSRTYASVNEGSMDGLVIAVEQITKTNPNIILVPTPLNHIHTTAFKIKENVKITDIDSLKQYRIGILRGYPLSKKLTDGMSRQITNDYTTLFSILKIDRIDIALAMRRETRRFLRDNPQFKGIQEHCPSLFSFPLYHFLNKKHTNLIKELDQVFIRLINEGVFEKLYQPYEI